MIFVSFILIGGILIFWFEGYPLLKNKQIKAFAIFVTLLLGGVSLNIGIILGFPIPLPTETISKILAPLYKPIAAWLKSGDS